MRGPGGLAQTAGDDNRVEARTAVAAIMPIFFIRFLSGGLAVFVQWRSYNPAMIGTTRRDRER
jgi:hypothetical protein